MPPITRDKDTTEFMIALWERVAAQDAAQDAQLAAIMERKPARPRKVEPEPGWIIKHTPQGKKSGAPSPAVTNKGWRKKPGRPRS